jgi:peptidoglycan/LPS O-acetylase OafA/YrhL
VSSTSVHSSQSSTSLIPDQPGLFKASSIFENLKTVWQTRPDAKSNYLSGIKAVCYLNIFTNHFILVNSFFPSQNPRKIAELMNSTWLPTLFRLMDNVDTFIFISGMLLTRSVLKDIKNGKLNIWRVYLRRYLRLTPLLIFLLLTMVPSFQLGSNSPIANMKVHERKCFECWWTLLLHVQNFVNPLDMVTNESLLFKLKSFDFSALHMVGRFRWTFS